MHVLTLYDDWCKLMLNQLSNCYTPPQKQHKLQSYIQKYRGKKEKYQLITLNPPHKKIQAWSQSKTESLELIHHLWRN